MSKAVNKVVRYLLSALVWAGTSLLLLIPSVILAAAVTLMLLGIAHLTGLATGWALIMFISLSLALWIGQEVVVAIRIHRMRQEGLV